MITFLEGLLVEKQPTTVVLGVNGVGYEVRIPLSSYDRLPGINQSCRLLTYDHVREDDHVLFGFISDAERQLFVLLMTVTGIGPKLALSVLSGMSVREIKSAIAGNDVKRLSSISGIGRKTAERMVVELRDKIGTGDAAEGGGCVPGGDGRLGDAALALISLGYKRAEAERLVRDVAKELGSEATVEFIVRKALAG